MAVLWTSPTEIPRLESGEIQVWRIRVEELAPLLNQAFSELAPDEQVRAQRFRVEPARAEFVFGRWMLRRLLGHVASVTPSELVFSVGPFGKLEVRTVSEIQFNISHSGGLILIAISRAGRVGVDAERVDTRRASLMDLVGIAKDLLGSEEVQALRGIAPGREAQKAFFMAWTRREAVAKADGRGITSAGAYTISRQRTEASYRASLESANGCKGEEWEVLSFEISDQYVGAVASPPKPRIIFCDGASLFFS